MPRKSLPKKTLAGQRPSRGRKLAELYPSLAEGPTPAQRRAQLLADAQERGIRPLTAAEFDRLLKGPSDWPDEDLDEFLAWLRQLRQEGR